MINGLVVQTYKKLILLLTLILLTSINECWSQSILHPFRKRYDSFSTSEHFRSFKLDRTPVNKQKPLSRIERKQNRKAAKAKKEALKSQEKDREAHIKKQTPVVQERMKKSREQSELTRRHKTFWEKMMFWKNRKPKKT